MDAGGTVPEQVVLVLQGGGALCAFQAGAYEALCRAGQEPDWVAGISIGSINAALIAGNRPGARLAALRGTEADFVLLTRRYEEMLAAHTQEDPVDPREHARLDHAFHLAICEASHNPVLVHTLQSLTDLMLSTVFASVNNLYHRPAQKRQIDRQHSRLYHAVIERLPEQAQRAARDHIHSIRDNLQEIEQEEQRLVRATMRLEGWA